MIVEIYINNTLIDYSENKALPFDLRVAYRDFKKIGETESIDLVNAASSLSIPATKTNKQIFEGHEHERFTIEVVRNSQNFFSGSCRLKSKQFSRSELKGYSLELYGGTADIFERLEGVSLRDLDLGLIGYSDAAITATWTGLTSSSNKCIYCPSVYGRLASGTENDFQIEDLRPSVYYNTILDGIAAYLGITIESSVIESDFFKRCVHLYGVGELWENAAGDIESNLVADGTTDTLEYTFPFADTVVFKCEVNVPSGNNSLNDLTHLEVTSDTGYSQIIPYDNTNGNNVVTAEINLDNVGEKIILEGQKSSGSAATLLPSGTQFLIKSTTKVVEGSAVKIETCLHDIHVKDWLKDLFLQFNLVSFYNPITKALRLDPPFPFEIDGTSYGGFYDIGATPIELKTDNRTVTKEYSPLYDLMAFHYLQDEATENLINQYTEHASHPLNCIEVQINDGQNSKEYKSLYENLANGLVDGITNKELPILVDSDVKLEDGAAAIGDPTFITNPKNALIVDMMSAYYEGVNYTTMPVARQNLYRSLKQYTLTFSDNGQRLGSNSGTGKGLISLFYKRYFSMLSRLEILTMTVEVSNVVDPETFTSIYKIEGDNYILIELKKVVYDSNLAEGVFVKLDFIRDTDDSFYTNFNPPSALQILNIQ